MVTGLHCRRRMHNLALAVLCGLPVCDCVAVRPLSHYVR
jgi:hypothetical protein